VRAGDVLARYGGDEFVVFCPAIDADRARAVAERIVAAVAQRLVVEGHVIHLGASVGVAMPADQSVGSGELVRVADVAMYEAKRAGKGRARLAIAGTAAVASTTPAEERPAPSTAPGRSSTPGGAER
jgi:diguanylate cyclase (GGDEF)-like protein